MGLNDALQTFSNALTPLAEVITNIKNMIAELKDKFQAAYEYVRDFFAPMLDVLKNLFNDLEYYASRITSIDLLGWLRGIYNLIKDWI